MPRKKPAEALDAVVSRLPAERDSVHRQVAVARALADELERDHRDRSSASLAEQFEEELARLERIGTPAS